jgi:hypothetical protein
VLKQPKSWLEGSNTLLLSPFITLQIENSRSLLCSLLHSSSYTISFIGLLIVIILQLESSSSLSSNSSRYFCCPLYLVPPPTLIRYFCCPLYLVTPPTLSDIFVVLLTLFLLQLYQVFLLSSLSCYSSNFSRYFAPPSTSLSTHH